MHPNEEVPRGVEPGSTSDSKNEQALDLMSLVEGLQGLGSQELSKIFRESGTVLRVIPSDGVLVQIDMEKLARYLALHLGAVNLAWKREKRMLEYLLSGVQLLRFLYELASRQPKLEQILLDDVKVSEQLIDLAFYLIITLCSTYMQEKGGLSDMALLHPTMVASTLYLSKPCISSQWQELAQVFLAHYKVDIFMDAAFAAIRLNVKFLGAKLSSEGANSNADSISETEEVLNYLCQQSEASVQFVQSLCQQKAFRERLVKNKDLCSKGGALLLAQAVLSLEISPRLKDYSSLVAALSRLKSKMLSILLNLCEAESVSYLDVVAGNPRSLELMKSIAQEVLTLLKRMFGMDFKQTACSGKIYPKGQLQLNAMRLADIFSDDSNFRSYITIHFTEVLTEIFLLPHGEFLSTWCCSDLSIWEEDAILEYDPFAAAGWVLTSCSSSVPLSSLNTESVAVSGNMSRACYAHQRTALLVKVIANLHCFVPDICKEDKDLFLTKFLQCLQRDHPGLSDRCSPISDAEKASIVSKNLGSLLGHADSLIPGFLNEEDVQLLRIFITQLESHIAPIEGGNHQVQESNFEGSVSWDKLLKMNISEHHQDVQSTEGCCSSPFLRDVAPIKNGIMKEAISENSSLPEGNQLNFKSNSMERSDGFGRQDNGTDMCNYKSTPGGLVEAENETQIVETSGDSSSTREKNPVDQEIRHTTEGGVIETQEEEKVKGLQHEERQLRKRKRGLLNEEQMALIKRALADEPDMHRRASSLKLWAQRLSIHGSDVTGSQLKNWLNNRKARMARAAKDGWSLSESDNPDKRCGLGNVPPQDTPTSPIDNIGVAPTAGGDNESGAGDITLSTGADENSMVAPRASNGFSTPGALRYEPGQNVILVNEKAEEIGKGKVHQVYGQWYGENLEESRTCVIDISELKVERFTKIPYPSDFTGTSFDQAEKRLGLMRVLWDSNKLLVLPPR